MPREALIAVGAGFVSALLSLTPVAFAAPLPLLLAGLSVGFRPAVISLAAGLLAKVYLDGFDATLHYGLVQALPSIMIVYLALTQKPQTATSQAIADWRPLGDIAATLTVFGGCLLALTAMMTMDTGLSHEVSAAINGFFDQVGPNFPDQLRRQYHDKLFAVFPGLITAILMIIVIVNAAMAHRVLVRIDKNLRPRPAYAALNLPQWLAWPLVIAAAMTLIGSGEWEYAWRNMALVFALPYFLLGLAVVHSLTRKVTFTGPLLVAFYLVIVVSLWAALVVAGIGVVEQWFGLRDRTGTSLQPTGDDEDN